MNKKKVRAAQKWHANQNSVEEKRGQKTSFCPKMTEPCPRNRLWIGLWDSDLGLQFCDFVCKSQMQAHDPTHIPFHLCTHIWCFAQTWEKILLLLPACGSVLLGLGFFFKWKIGILTAFGEKCGKGGETYFMRLRANPWKVEMEKSGGAWQLPCSGSQTVLVPLFEITFLTD